MPRPVLEDPPPQAFFFLKANRKRARLDSRGDQHLVPLPACRWETSLKDFMVIKARIQYSLPE